MSDEPLRGLGDGCGLARLSEPVERQIGGSQLGVSNVAETDDAGLVAGPTLLSADATGFDLDRVPSNRNGFSHALYLAHKAEAVLFVALRLPPRGGTYWVLVFGSLGAFDTSRRDNLTQRIPHPLADRASGAVDPPLSDPALLERTDRWRCAP
jgi:hypothetical protein